MSGIQRVEDRSPADGELVALVLGGDLQSYTALVARYQGGLYRLALGMVGSEDAAADLVQECLIAVYRRLASCRDPARFGPWVFTILRNRCLDHLRSQRRRTLPLLENTAYASESDDPELRLERAELNRAVSAALRALPASQREAFILKHVEGRSYEEMAEILEVSVSALKMRVMRARESLQSQLAGEAARLL